MVSAGAPPKGATSATRAASRTPIPPCVMAEQPGLNHGVLSLHHRSERAPETYDEAPQTERQCVRRHESLQPEENQGAKDESYRRNGKDFFEQLPPQRIERFGQQQNTGQSQTPERSHIHEAIEDAAHDSRSTMPREPQRQADAHDVSTNNRRKEQRAKQAAAVAADRLRVAQSGSGRVQHQPPFDDPDGMDQEIGRQHEKPQRGGGSVE